MRLSPPPTLRARVRRGRGPARSTLQDLEELRRVGGESEALVELPRARVRAEDGQREEPVSARPGPTFPGGHQRPANAASLRAGRHDEVRHMAVLLSREEIVR